jgi:hypothetical protein
MQQQPQDLVQTTGAEFDPDADRLREECGVFGIFGHPDAAAITALGLHALQHRGQEAAGIVSFDGKRFHSERRLGLVGDAFARREVIDRLPGTAAIGHVRYSTTGETVLRNVQPLFAELEGGGFAIGHNGNLTNGIALRKNLVHEGAMMQSTTDTEVILHLVARARHQMQDHLGVGGRLHHGAFVHQVLAQRDAVGQVAVVADGEAAAFQFREQRLHVAQHRFASGRIAHMADGRGAGQAVDHFPPREGVAYQAEAALGMEALAVEADDAGGFLAAMLERVQAERGDGGGVGMAENAEHAAFLA